MLLIASLTMLSAVKSSAQSLSAGFESNSMYYLQDKTTGATLPVDRFGTNDYLKMDLTWGKFTAGVQAEGYLPAIQGYPSELNNFKIPYRYVSFSDENFSVTVGDFYTQFGSGMLLRAWEDRSLGINTALEGVNVKYSLNDVLRISALYAKQRTFFTYSDAWQRGADLSFSLSSLLNMENVNITLEGSYLNKFEELLNPDSDSELGMKNSTNGYSGRFNFDASGFVFKAEYVDRDPDASIANDLCLDRSRAYLVETGYYGSGIGVNLAFRHLENMGMQIARESKSMYTLSNYLPALTQQHIYSLASINPYQTQASGETGGQLDVFYNIARGTKLGGKRGTKLHLNSSAWFAPETAERRLLFSDITFDVEKQWNKTLKTKVLYSFQEYNPLVRGVDSDHNWVSHIAVADVTYKFNPKNALRGEVQHLATKDDLGNWAAMLMEYSFAPKWSFFVSDMWNYDKTDVHYVSGGVSLALSKTRFELNAGRFREGYQCAGGVCRYTPAYTGANLVMTMIF